MSNEIAHIGLNAQQSAFVTAIVEGHAPHDAARVAGYSVEKQAVYRLMNAPAVMAAIHAGVQASLQQDVGASLKVLRKIRDDESAPARVRADIGIKLLNLAGHVAPSKAGDKPQKQLSEMTREEMLRYIEDNQAAIDKAEQELAARATEVHGVTVSVPSPAVIDAKPLTYLD